MIDLAYIIPARNALGTIGRTLESVLAQHHARIAAIVVDDGSDDGTADSARSTRDWRVQVVSQRRLGLAGARNTGLEALGDRARAVCFLDADDTVEPGHASALCDALHDDRRDAPDAVVASYRMVGPDLQPLGWTIEASPLDADPARLIEFNPMAVGAIALRVGPLLDAAGPRPFDESLPVHEDWDLWLRLGAARFRWGGMRRPDEPLFNYRIRPGSLSRDVERMWLVGRRIIERAPLEHPERSELRASAMRRWTVRHIARAAVARPDLIPAMLADLDRLGGRTLADADRAALVGSLRHAFLLEHAAGPARAAAFQHEWRALARHAMAPWPDAAEAIDSLTFDCWQAVARRLADLLARRRPGATPLRPVIAGMGRNGRALAAALRQRHIPFDCYDDHPGADPALLGGPRPARRLTLGRLGERHVVIVTPADPGDMAERLRATRALVLTPAQLVRPAPDALIPDAMIPDAGNPEAPVGRRVA